MPNNTAPQTLSIERFVGQVFMWLGPLFFLWFIAAESICFPAIFLSDFLLPHLFPSIVTGLEQQGYMADIVTALSTQDAEGRSGVMVIETNALIYVYGLPLLIAMTLATNEPVYKKIDTLIYGLLIILLVQVWGICFGIGATLLLKMGVGIYEQIIAIIPFYGMSFASNGVALGYQLGSLIFPVVVPIAYWALKHQEFLKKITQ